MNRERLLHNFATVVTGLQFSFSPAAQPAFIALVELMQLHNLSMDELFSFVNDRNAKFDELLASGVPLEEARRIIGNYDASEKASKDAAESLISRLNKL